MGGWQHRPSPGCSGSAPCLTLGPCSGDEVVCRGLQSSFRSEPQGAGRRGRGSQQVCSPPLICWEAEELLQHRPRCPLEARVHQSVTSAFATCLLQVSLQCQTAGGKPRPLGLGSQWDPPSLGCCPQGIDQDRRTPSRTPFYVFRLLWW